MFTRPASVIRFGESSAGLAAIACIMGRPISPPKSKTQRRKGRKVS